MFLFDAGRQVIAKLVEILALALEIVHPTFTFDGHQLFEVGLGNLESIAVETRSFWYVADGGFFRGTRSPRSFYDPTKHAQILPEARPKELPLLVSLEPVDAKNLWRIGGSFGHGEPVLPVVSHVVTAEGQHRHRIAAHHAHGAGGGRCSLGGQGGAEKGSVLPIERLINQRDEFLPPRAKQNSADGHSLRLLPFGRVGGTLLDRYRKP